MKPRYLLADHTITTAELAELSTWLRTNPWLTQGPLCAAFEQRWANWLGVEHALYVNSGSSANLLMYYALLVSGRLRNQKVVVPAVAWATTVAPAIQLGFEPILCEADPQDFGLDMTHLETVLREHDPAVVIIVHVLGVPNQMEALLRLKEQYGFILMEDSCAALGSRYDDQPVGTFGDLSTFSFYYGHHISTIEGGMVCTNDEQLHDILLHLRSHGWPKDLPAEKEQALAQAHGVINFNRRFTFYYPGFNLRSTDLNAKIGLMQMQKLDWVIGRRSENHRIYQSRFLAAPDFTCQVAERSQICSISFAALATSPAHRERVAAALDANGVETRPLGGGNMSRQPFWSDRYGTTAFSTADRIHTTSFQLPNHPELSPADITAICDTVLAVK